MMKKLIPFLFLLFFLGCDRGPIIEDFKIEGVGLGDSLLDIMTKDEILEEISNPQVSYETYSPPNLFYEFFTSNNLETYYEMSFYVYADDEKYIIQSINGFLKNSTLDGCYAEQDKISLEFKEMFTEAEYYEPEIYDHAIIDGISIRESSFLMPEGEILVLQCWDVRNEDYMYDRQLTISIDTPELFIWLAQG